MGVESYNKYVASIKFTSDKVCFLRIPRRWRENYHDELLILKIKFGENEEKVIYMSCGRNEVTHRDDVESKVFINGMYAAKLGLKEKEQAEIIPIITSNVPIATRVILEPLTSDDWSIMELNARYIENNLMNQIRVVCVNQVFPVWMSHGALAWGRIVACEPNHSPVILSEYTEVSVVPKDQHALRASQQDNSSTSSFDQGNKSSYLQFQNLRVTSIFSQTYEDTDEDEEVNNKLAVPESPLRHSMPYFAFLSNAWLSSASEEKVSEDSDLKECSGEFHQFNFESVLRVLPYSNNNLPLVKQATTVFISASTYVANCGDKEIPPCFVAILQKFPLPLRKRRGINDSNTSNARDGYQSDNSSITKNETKPKDSDLSESQKLFEYVCVSVMVMKSAEEDEFNLPLSLYTYKNAIVIPKELKRSFNLEVASLVHLKSVESKPLSVSQIILHPVTDVVDKQITEKIIQEHYHQWAFGKNKRNNTYVISDGTFVKLKINGAKYEFYTSLRGKDLPSKNSQHSGSFNSLERRECDYALLNRKSIKRIPIKVGVVMCLECQSARPYLRKEDGLYLDIKSPRFNDLGGVKELFARAIEDIEFWLKLKPLSYISNHSSTNCGGILICGPKGVGKTSFANAICKEFANSPYWVFVRSIQCLPLKGKRVETIAKRWDDIVMEAIYSQPSLILFEDLDYIASSPVSHEQENGPDGVYFASISQAFIHLMNKITEGENKVAILATCQSLHSLHSSLVNTRGRHIFQSVIEVNPPNAEQREDILKALIKLKPNISDQDTVESVQFSDIAAKTEGYVAQDLGSLVDRATHAAWVRLASSYKCDHIKLKNEDFEVALKSFVPYSLRGISLQMQEQRTWNDVGGLKEVKKVIQQIILWPTKYKQIYKHYSLKPQTNILLYGAPGTGKTLLAGVVASECGLNFISIKGPELLSKYIGASEQAVRDLFKRATTARPCILFFDEFDSIAPRRGHDSTGVTDRVVNQLLTQLDGVESLEGVHVLAATSRPELIDPALLRPGRLDKCLICPLPDKEGRKEILECLSSKMPLSSDIDFDMIASLTEHFSGADLQALLYTAHIEALHEIQYSSKRHYSTSSEDAAYSEASDKILYVQSLEEGLMTPSYEDGQKIVQDVSVVKEKSFHKKEQCTSRRSSLSALAITQMHLLKVAGEMRPSVSAEERFRYMTIFEKFQNSLSGEPTTVNENMKRATLA